MRTSHYLLATQRETPSEAELISHQLMLKAGLIRKLASGLYTWLPTGLKVLRKVEGIIREEMCRAGASEILMSAVQPAELWEESGRWNQFGPELLRLKDRHQRDFCIGPTHEEVITDLMRDEIRSYKQLPANFFQIQMKFRDERRPRFGVMRSREFLMKDAYSFHIDKNCLEKTYQVMYEAYARIFTRLGLDFRAVIADTGAIGGSASHEFHVLADSGEDAIAVSDTSDYAANLEKAESLTSEPSQESMADTKRMCETPKAKTIEQVCQCLNISAQKTVKTLLVKGATEAHPVIALCLRGDHTLNEVKAEKHDLVQSPVELVDEASIQSQVNCEAGFIGPCDLNMPVIVDPAAKVLNNFVCGANQNEQHFMDANWEKDVVITDTFDIRNVEEGDPSPDGKGQLVIKRGIEVGHIFQLGTKYSEAMNANVLNESGKATVLNMGCYGIGVSRIVAAAIEQNYDDYGIIWPESMAPFTLVIVPMNMHRSHRVQEAAESLYTQCVQQGIEVLFDDRKERPGVMFADTELIGIPHRFVISEKGLEKATIEYKSRRNSEKIDIPLENALNFIQQRLEDVSS